MSEWTPKRSRREKLRVAAVQAGIAILKIPAKLLAEPSEPEMPYDPLAGPVIIIEEVALIQIPPEATDGHLES